MNWGRLGSTPRKLETPVTQGGWVTGVGGKIVKLTILESFYDLILWLLSYSCQGFAGANPSFCDCSALCSIF